MAVLARLKSVGKLNVFANVTIDSILSSNSSDLVLQRAGVTKVTFGTAGTTFVDNITTANVFCNFIKSSCSVDNLSASNYIYDSGDGYLRKKTIQNVKSELGIISSIATQINKGLMSATDKIKLDNTLKIIKGSSSFVGLSNYKQISLGVTMNDTSYAVQITPTTAPSGELGEVWVVKSTTNICVYNSGSCIGSFDYTIFY